jgi:hypothetical protein
MQIQKEIDKDIAVEKTGADLPWGEATPAPSGDE